MQLRSRRGVLLIGAIAVAVALLLLGATIRGGQYLQGSTYSRAPAGYGAWWQWMTDQQIPVQRWQKPPAELGNLTEPATLLRINPQGLLGEGEQNPLRLVNFEERQWLNQGNRLVYLGRLEPLTTAPFTQTIDSDHGPVTIQGRRRGAAEKGVILADQFGSLIWREPVGQGEIIWVVPPFLAANAFQDQPANFKLLQDLVTAGPGMVWVDEYLHGYKDQQTLESEARGTVWGYLQQTPLFPLFVQLILLSLLLLFWGNCRFGRPHQSETKPVPNNLAYVQALAQVLAKGDRPKFVVEQIIQGELPQLQRRLQALANDGETMDSPAAKLDQLLNPGQWPQNEAALRRWLTEWQELQKRLTPGH